MKSLALLALSIFCMPTLANKYETVPLFSMDCKTQSYEHISIADDSGKILRTNNQSFNNDFNIIIEGNGEYVHTKYPNLDKYGFYTVFSRKGDENKQVEYNSERPSLFIVPKSLRTGVYSDVSKFDLDDFGIRFTAISSVMKITRGKNTGLVSGLYYRARLSEITTITFVCEEKSLGEWKASTQKIYDYFFEVNQAN